MSWDGYHPDRRQRSPETIWTACSDLDALLSPWLVPWCPGDGRIGRSPAISDRAPISGATLRTLQDWWRLLSKPARIIWHYVAGACGRQPIYRLIIAVRTATLLRIWIASASRCAMVSSRATFIRNATSRYAVVW